MVASLFACINEQSLQPDVSNRGAHVQAESSDFTIRHGHYLLLPATDMLPAGLASDIAKANGRLGAAMGHVGIATATSDDPNFVAKASQIAGIQAVMAEVSSG